MVHIGPMSSPSNSPLSNCAALLSAVSASEAGTVLATVGGETVLHHQIAALRNIGIDQFLVEVDSVPGALLVMADRFKSEGCRFDFVRSPTDLQEKLPEVDRLIIQAEGIYINPDLLSVLTGRYATFLATVDERIENEAFERMDINTRWAGFAVVPISIVSGVAALPQGWSLTSSLLRQAMQDGIVRQALKQNHLQDGDLRRIDSFADVKKLADDVLAQRAGQEPGFIESGIFGPVATRIAPLLWRMKSHAEAVDITVVGLGLLSLGLAGYGWTASAVGSAIAAIFANSLRQIVSDVNQRTALKRWIEPTLWLLLGGALLLATAADDFRFSDGLFAGAVVGGLSILARHLQLPDWARRTLQSPALIAVSLLVFALMTGLATAAKCVGVAQIALLVVAKWNHKPKP